MKVTQPKVNAGPQRGALRNSKYLLLLLLLQCCFIPAQAQYQLTSWGVQHHTMSTATGTTGSGSAGQVYIHRVATDRQKNIYSVGIFEDTIKFAGGYSPLIVNTQMPTGTGQYEFFISKMDADSNMIWVKKLDKRNFIFNHIYNGPSARGLVVDDSANIYIAGDFPGVVDFNPDPAAEALLSGPDTTLTTSKAGFVLKLDSAGNFKWVKQIVSRKVPFVGIYKMAATFDVQSLAVNTSGEMILSGTVLGTGQNDTLIFDNGGANTQHIISTNSGLTDQRYGFWVKMDQATGAFNSFRIVKTTEKRGGIYDFKAAPDPYGHIYVAGSLYDTVNFGTVTQPHVVTTPISGTQRYSPFLAKYTDAGDVLWVKTFNCYQGTVKDLSLDTAGVPVIAGTFLDTLRLSPSLLLTAINGGMPDAHINGGYIAKTDTSGAVQWGELLQLGMPLTDNQIIPTRLKHDALNNIYIGGSVVAEFNIAGITYQTNTHGFVKRYKPGGATDWSMRLGQLPHISAQQVPVGEVFLDQSNNMYIAGTLRRNAADFKGPNDTAPYVMTQAGNNFDMGAYLVKYACADTFHSITQVSACKSYSLNGITYTNSGVYNQHYWSDGGCDSLITIDLTINDIDEPFITVNNFELGVTSAYDTYKWMRNGILINGATAATYTVNQNGDYQVITGLVNGCTDTSEIYTVNNVTGIDDIGNPAYRISIYPNPAQHTLFIDSPIPVSLSLGSVEGRTLLQSDNTDRISLEALPDGIYFLKIADAKGRLLRVEKVVKQ